MNSNKTRNIIPPSILNIRCINAVRLAILLAPIHARRAVIHVPILNPMKEMAQFVAELTKQGIVFTVTSDVKEFTIELTGGF